MKILPYLTNGHGLRPPLLLYWGPRGDTDDGR